MNALEKIQADLDEIADEVDDLEVHVDDGVHDLADRLRNLLTDRGLDVPPLTSEIIAWLEADPNHIVEAWRSDVNEWARVIAPIVDVWRERLAQYGDQRQHGYRLGVREPATERVRLDQLPGRTLPGEAVAVHWLRWNTSLGMFGWSGPGGATWKPLDIAPDGTVEVLKDDSK